jgi:hypothetical protein
MRDDFGVIYVATGENYIREAAQSAVSVREHMPEMPLAIWVDDDALLPGGLFGRVTLLENPQHSFFDKIEPLIDSPFAKTLFLDTDTQLLAPVWELADLLARFDLAYCHAPYRCIYELEACPASFPEPNTGVILYNRKRAVRGVFREWARIYREHLALDPPPMHDQPALRQAVYDSSISCTVLPPEYNLRTIFPYFAGGNLPVKILHGREPSLSAIRRIVNDATVPRVGYLTP